MTKQDWRGPALRPFIPKVTRLDPGRYSGCRWVIDGRRTERYTKKTWRMCVHWMHALVFG